MTRSAEHQVRRPHHHRHVIDVLPHIQQRTAETQPLQLAGHMGPVALSGGVDVVEGKAVRLLPPEEVQHPGVHGGRTQTAPEGGHQRLIVGIAQLFTGLLLRQSEEIAPHRRSRDHHLFGVLIVAAAVLEPHHHAVHAALQQLGGQAGDHVGLVDGGGNMPPGGGLDGGIAGVAAGAHHQIRLEGANDGVRLTAGGHQGLGGLEIVAQRLGRQGAVEVADLHGGKVIARLFDQAPLHAVGGAHEQYAGGGVFFPQIACQRQRRIHMSGGAAAGKDHIHSKQLLWGGMGNTRFRSLGVIARERAAHLYLAPLCKGVCQRS